MAKKKATSTKTAAKKAPAKKATAKKATAKKATTKAAATAKKTTKGNEADAAPVKKKRKSRVSSAEVVRRKLFWGVFNHAMKRVALYEFNQRKAAEKRAAELSPEGKPPHFVQKVKEDVVEEKEKKLTAKQLKEQAELESAAKSTKKKTKAAK